MIYGYARVSTKGQDRHGNSLPEQEAELRAAGCTEIYHDSYTGAKMERPAFSELMSKLVPGDTLAVTKLDRFARTAADGAKTIQSLVARGIEVNVLNMGKANNTPMGKFMRLMLLAFAEYERDMIIERTTAGKEIKRSTDPNWKEGRKKIEIPDFQKFLEKQKGGQMSVAECCEQLHISRRTWYNKVQEAAAG